MRTEIAFTLPRGFVDSRGTLHKEGVMRLATARDELESLRSAEVRSDETRLAVALLARVITKIGTVTEIDEDTIEGLFAADFDHLQRLYERLNTDGSAVGVVSCPTCEAEFEVDLTEIEDRELGEA